MFHFNLQKIVRAAGLGLFVGLVFWFGALCFAANSVNRSSKDVTYRLRAGPLLLNTIQRKTTDKGTEASISVHWGLASFVGCTAAVTSAIVTVSQKFGITRYKSAGRPVRES